MNNNRVLLPFASLRRVIALGITLIIGVSIAALTLLPIDLPPNSVPGSDKVHHLIAFAAFTFPCALIYRRAVRWVLPFALIFGVLIELIQPYVGRHGEITDFYADALGALLGLVMGLIANVLIMQPFGRRYIARHVVPSDKGYSANPDAKSPSPAP